MRLSFIAADKLNRNIVKVSKDPRGFAERENERQTEIKRNKQVRGNLDIVSQNDSETPRDVKLTISRK